MDKIIIDIRKFEKEKDFNSLGSYLIDLVKHGNNPIKYENEFKKHLQSTDWYMRKVAVFCLLFALQIDKPEYRSKAIEFVTNPNENEEVRSWAASGLSATYQKTKDKALLKLFLNIIQAPEEGKSIKGSILSSALLVYGLTSREQLLRNEKSMPKLEDLLKTFEPELNDIEKIM